jgi:hypothetical protein
LAQKLLFSGKFRPIPVVFYGGAVERRFLKIELRGARCGMSQGAKVNASIPI